MSGFRGGSGNERTSTRRRAAASALRLALGRPAAAGTDWHLLLRVASALRLAPLVWVRSAALIRAHATPEVTAAWRQQYGIAAARATQRLDVALRLLARLCERGVDAGVGKGIVLGSMLYGDSGARWSSDLDIYIALDQRPAALGVMLAEGWTRTEGVPPYDETFLRQMNGEAAHVEIHSGLVHPRLSHLPRVEPRLADHLVEGRVLRGVAASELPVMLAMHLAKHQYPPLLWDVDFHSAWSALDEAGQADALQRARDIGLDRYVTWAARRSLAVARVADGDDRALARLGYHGHLHRGSHPMWRHTRLAPTWRARAACVHGWMLPPWVDTSDGVSRALLRRTTGMWRQLFPSFRSAADGRATARSP